MCVSGATELTNVDINRQFDLVQFVQPVMNNNAVIGYD